MQIVEINISPYLDGNIADTQARVIECESWEKYVSYFTEYNGEEAGDYNSIHGLLNGLVVPGMAAIRDLEYNDHQLVCTIYNYNNQPTKKIACIVR